MANADYTRIVVADPADFDTVCDLLVACCLPTEGLADHMATCLVVRQKGVIAGSVALELYGQSALLRSLAVRADQRGSGLGKALTTAALTLAADHAVANVYLLTETAPQFFSRLGFSTVSRTDVPELVRHSLEFTTACPDTAQAMHRALG